MTNKIKLIIGLGNPEKKYQQTYHNIGMLFVDYLSDNKISSDYKILKSSVYMNESGRFVTKALKENNAKTENLLVVHEDSDIKLGEYKLSFNRNSAGHKGIESIINYLKSKNFWRLRIGIRDFKKSIQQKKASSFVLKKISKSNLEIIKDVFDNANEKIKSLL